MFYGCIGKFRMVASGGVTKDEDILENLLVVVSGHVKMKIQGVFFTGTPLKR